MAKLSAVEVLSMIDQHGGFVRCSGKIQAVGPRIINEERHDVSTADNRGGFIRALRVPTGKDGKTSVNWLTLDLQTTDHVSQKASWTNISIARYSGTRFEYVNSEFDARLTKDLFEKFVEIGVCERPKDSEKVDLRKLVKIKISHLPIFPEFVPDADYAKDKISAIRLSKKLEKLTYLKRAAREYLKKNDITFAELEPFQEREKSKEPKIKVEVPYTSYIIEPQCEIEPLEIDETRYRVKEGRGYVYTRENYLNLIEDIETIKTDLKYLAQSVRIRELSYLEHRPQETVFQAGEHKFTKFIETTYETFYLTREEVEEFKRKNQNAVIVEQ